MSDKTGGVGVAIMKQPIKLIRFSDAIPEGYEMHREWIFLILCNSCKKKYTKAKLIEYRTNAPHFKNKPFVRLYYPSGLCSACHPRGIHSWSDLKTRQARAAHKELMRNALGIDSSASNGEKIMRKLIKEIFPTEDSIYNAKLRNMAGDLYEVDIFVPEKKLAFEYNGIQHYKFIKFFHKNEKEFRKRQLRDKLRRAMCKEKEITLIEINCGLPLEKKTIVSLIDAAGVMNNENVERIEGHSKGIAEL